jgi:dTMP kinase
MNASRAQLVDEVIIPARDRDEDVLMDRFFYSSIAYQGYGRKLPLSMVNGVIKAAVGRLRPQHVFLLTIPVEVCLARRLGRQSVLPFAQDRFEKEDLEFFNRVAIGYSKIAADDPKRIHVIDATKSVETIHQEICEILCLSALK